VEYYLRRQGVERVHAAFAAGSLSVLRWSGGALRPGTGARNRQGRRSFGPR